MTQPKQGTLEAASEGTASTATGTSPSTPPHDYKLWLDDVRPAPDGYIHASSYDDACAIVEKRGCPVFISFDYDLGICSSRPLAPAVTGHDFAKWLVKAHLQGRIDFPVGFGFAVHSSDTVRGGNITKLLQPYLEYVNSRQNELPADR